MMTRDASSAPVDAGDRRRACDRMGTRGRLLFRGFALCSKNQGDIVTVSYQCDSVHDIYLGTSLSGDRGSLRVEVDGASVQDANLARPYPAAVITRRKIASSIPAGRHTLKLTHTDSQPVYFDSSRPWWRRMCPMRSRLARTLAGARLLDGPYVQALAPAAAVELRQARIRRADE